MPYIGKAPVNGGFHKLDNLTASATATYALTLRGAAYFPETANHLLVSLNGVMQAPQDSFTISGSNIVFASALTSNDSIDFIMALGDVLSVGTPTDGTITTAKIANQAVTMDKLATSGTLPALDGSALTGVSAGKILQVVSVSMDNALSISSSSTSNFADVTGLVASITPSATGSKVLVMVSTTLHHSAAYIIHVTVERTIGGTATKLGTANVSNRVGSVMSTLPVNSWYGVSMHPVSFQLVDSPNTTSACSYQVQVTLGATYNGTIYVNRTNNDNDADYSSRTKSTITLIEVGA